MILKVGTPYSEIRGNTGWRIYDDVRQLHYHVEEISERLNGVCPPDDCIVEVFHNTTQSCSASKGPENLFASFYSRDDIFHLYADTEVYLLNDNGKTIEKLY